MSFVVSRVPSRSSEGPRERSSRLAPGPGTHRIQDHDTMSTRYPRIAICLGAIATLALSAAPTIAQTSASSPERDGADPAASPERTLQRVEITDQDFQCLGDLNRRHRRDYRHYHPACIAGR